MGQEQVQRVKASRGREQSGEPPSDPAVDKTRVRKKLLEALGKVETEIDKVVEEHLGLAETYVQQNGE